MPGSCLFIVLKRPHHMRPLCVCSDRGIPESVPSRFPLSPTRRAVTASPRRATPWAIRPRTRHTCIGIGVVPFAHPNSSMFFAPDKTTTKIRFWNI